MNKLKKSELLLANFRKVRSEYKALSDKTCARAYDCKKYIALVEETVNLVRSSDNLPLSKRQTKFTAIKNEVYYWILYITYLEGDEERTGSDAILELKNRIDISFAHSTYLKYKNEAIFVFSQII